MAEDDQDAMAMTFDVVDATANLTPVPTRWQILAGLGVLALAAWLVLMFFEGDRCLDAGGAFHALAYRCELADGQHYAALISQARWSFWAIHALVTVLVAAPLCALGAGLAAGLACGLHSLWRDVIRR